MYDSLEYIAEAIKKARKKKGLSQRELSAKTHIPQSHISKIEQAKVALQITGLIQIARALDLELMLISRPNITAVQAIENGLLKEDFSEGEDDAGI